PHTMSHSSHTHADQPHSHGDYVDANKAFFNETAPTYDDLPGTVEIAQRQAAAMRKAYPSLFNEDTTTLMDYACGTGTSPSPPQPSPATVLTPTGLISRELCPYVKSIVGVDISQGMVDQFNLRVANQGLAPEEMRAECVTLTASAHELGGARFDVIVCAAAYHHFASVEETTRVLAGYLKPGGVLLVSDVLSDAEGSVIFPAHTHHVIAHKHGLSEADMRRTFEGAGLTDFELAELFECKIFGKDITVFLAKGVKPLGE
ncbi:hypothetical protein A0H81_04916, partial [Grifola frondosa]